MGWIIALLAVAALAVLPMGVSAVYGDGGTHAWLLIGPMRLRVYPGKKKDKPKQAQEVPKPSGSAGSKKSGGPVSDFLPLVKLILALLTDFRRKLRVDRLELDVILAGDDPCDLATNYGRAWAALGNLWPQLERLFVIKKRHVEIQCDFEAGQTLVNARLDLTITLGRLLSLGAFHGLRILKEFLAVSKKRKGGATI